MTFILTVLKRYDPRHYSAQRIVRSLLTALLVFIFSPTMFVEISYTGCLIRCCGIFFSFELFQEAKVAVRRKRPRTPSSPRTMSPASSDLCVQSRVVERATAISGICADTKKKRIPSWLSSSATSALPPSSACRCCASIATSTRATSRSSAKCATSALRERPSCGRTGARTKFGLL